MSEQNKIDEIKEALAAATPGPWYSYGTEVFIETGPIAKLWGGGPKGEFRFENHENNAFFIAQSPEYITYLLQEIERKDEALRFYADVKNYEEVEVAENHFVSPEITLDAGNRAREAL